MLALITGASSGIGEALAHEHATKGGNLILVARREQKLQAMKEEFKKRYGVQVDVISKDLSKPDAAQELHAEVQNRQLVVDYLINNAGFGGQGKFHEQDWSRHANMIQVNITALTELTYLFLPGMVERNSGRIMNVASTAAMVPAGPLQSVYFATKQFVLSFSQGIAGELLDTNVTVTALCPGPIATEFSKTAGLENTDLFAKAYSPQSVAKDGYSAMEKGKFVEISGLSFSSRILMAATWFLPKKTMLRQVRKMQEVHD